MMTAQHYTTDAAIAARLEAVRLGHSFGWSYTPLKGKVPTRSRWQAEPRETLAEAETWAALGNVGLRTGPMSGVIVVDVDPGGKLPNGWPTETVTVETPRGCHYYYSFLDGCSVSNSVGKLADHVDVRGSGGQVVAPGSTNDAGAMYRWAPGKSPSDVDLAPWPVELHERLTAKTKPPQATPAVTVPPNSVGSAYLKKALREELAAVSAASEGTRNATLNTVAFKLGGLVGPNPESVKAALLNAAIAAGLPEGEAAKTLESGWNAGAAKPRSVAILGNQWHPDPDGHPSDGGGTEAASGPVLEWYPLGEDWDSEVLPPTDFVLGYCIPAGVVTALVAAPGVGKSWLGATLAVSVATGKSLIPGLAPARRGPVALATLEEDGIEVHRRLQKIARAYNLSASECATVRDNLAVLPACLLRALTRGADRAILPGPDLVELRNHLHETGTRLFVLDTLSAALGGIADENAASDMAPVMACLRDMLPKDCALLLICHTGKNVQDTTARGSSAQEGSIRSRLTLRRATAEETKGLPEDHGIILVLEHGKSNLGEEGKPIYLERLSGHNVGGALVPFDLTSTMAAKQAAEAAELRQAILTVLSTEDVTKTNLGGSGSHKDGNARGAMVRDKISALCGGRKVTIPAIKNEIAWLENAAQLFVDPRTQYVKPAHPVAPWGIGA